jgi:serine/threonine protein kinase/WD40 repeat protein
MPDSVTHPTLQDLIAFGQGKLSAAAAEAVAQHLRACPSCRTAAQKAADAFLGKVRDARPAPSGTRLSAAPPPSDLPAELAQHSKYRIVRELGRGGMGVVYQAVQTLMDRPVALKVMNPAVLAHPDALPRFHAEVKAAARLDHPNIVRAYDAEQVGNLHLLVMEFVEGMSLAQVVERQGPLPVTQACHGMHQALLGLHHAFEQGMTHRDVKPQNLMRTAKGQIKILDFGLARLRGEGRESRGLTEAGSFMGTPEYVAPEQATDARTADTRADIYSLGCTLYFLLTGRPPFVEDTVVKLVLAHIEKEPRPLHELRPDVPAELSAVVGRMLVKEPGQRYQTPIEAARALAPFCKAPDKSGPLPVLKPPPPGVASPGGGTVVGGDTSREKGPAKAAPRRPAPKAGGKEGSPFSDLAEGPAPTARREKKERKTERPGSAPWWKRPAVLAAILPVVLTLGVLAAVLVNSKEKPNDDGRVAVANPPSTTAHREPEKAPSTRPAVQPREPLTPVVEPPPEAKDPESTPRDPVVRPPVPPMPEPVKPVQPPPPPLPKPKPTVKRPPPAEVDAKVRRAYRTFMGDWRIEGGELVHATPRAVANLIFGDFTWKDYDFSARVKVNEGGTVALRYRVNGKGSGNFVLDTAGPNTKDRVATVELGKFEQKGDRPGSLQVNRWHAVRVSLRGAHCQCFLDGRLAFEYDDARNPRGAVGFWATQASRIDNIRVADPEGRVLFLGLPELPAAIDLAFPLDEAPPAGELHCLKAHAPVTSVVFSRDGRRLLSSSDGDYAVRDPVTNTYPRFGTPGTAVRLWDADTGTELDAVPADGGNDGGPVFHLTRSPGTLSFIGNLSPRGDPRGKKVLLWEIAEDKLKSRLLFAESVPFLAALGFTPDGKQVLALGEAGSVWRWDVSSKTLVKQLPGPIKPPAGFPAAVFAPDRRHALLWQWGNQPHPFAEIDLRTGQLTGRWKDGAANVTGLVYADARRVLSGANDGTLHLWDAALGKHLTFFSAHQGAVRCLACSPDGRRALSGGADQTVRLWDLAGKKELACFTAHAGLINAVAFSPDGRRAASASSDYTVRLWQLPP